MFRATDRFENWFITTLETDVNDTTTTFRIGKILQANNARLIIDPYCVDNREIVRVTAKDGNLVTVVRGDDHTDPDYHLAGTMVACNVTAGDLNDLMFEWKELQDYVGNGFVPSTRTINGIPLDQDIEIVALPDQTGAENKYLKSDGTNATWEELGGLNTTLVPDELLAGTINGVNKVFTTATAFSAIKLAKNGITLHVGDDFDITGANQITMKTAPAITVPATKITGMYITQSSVMIEGSNSMVFKERVIGVQNGINGLFTTQRPYQGGTLMVYRSGAMEGLLGVVETNPALGTFTIDAPVATEDICVSYMVSLATSGNADTIDGIHANASPTPNTLLPLDSSKRFPASTTPVGFKTLFVNFNNGTGARSVNNNANLKVAIPGATGDTSYTAPVDVDIIFTMSLMMMPGTSTFQAFLSINGVQAGGGTYYEPNKGWSVQSVTQKVSVNAGSTITIGALWFSSINGQASICNNNVDVDFETSITGIVIPRVV